MNWSHFLPAALLLVVTPGAGTLSVWRAYSGGGWQHAAWALLGLMLGDMLLIALSALGMAALLAAHPAWFDLLRYGGAAYLIWLGCRCWAATARQTGGATLSGSHACWSSWLVTVGNPKAIVFFMAFFPQFLTPQQPVLAGFLQLGAVFCLCNLLYLSGMLWLSRRMYTRFAKQVLASWGQKACGVMFVLLGLRIWWQRQPA